MTHTDRLVGRALLVIAAVLCFPAALFGGALTEIRAHQAAEATRVANWYFAQVTAEAVARRPRLPAPGQPVLPAAPTAPAVVAQAPPPSATPSPVASTPAPTPSLARAPEPSPLPTVAATSPTAVAVARQPAPPLNVPVGQGGPVRPPSIVGPLSAPVVLARDGASVIVTGVVALTPTPDNRYTNAPTNASPGANDPQAIIAFARDSGVSGGVQTVYVRLIREGRILAGDGLTLVTRFRTETNVWTGPPTEADGTWAIKIPVGDLTPNWPVRVEATVLYNGKELRASASFLP
jgi:hypothetical protein